MAAVSTGRRNAFVKSLRRRVEVQSFPRPLVEPPRDFIEVSLRVRRQIGLPRKILPQEQVGVLV